MLVEVAPTLASGSVTEPPSPLHPARAPATISSEPRRPFMVRVCGLVIAGCPRVALIIADQPRLVALPAHAAVGRNPPGRQKSNGARDLGPPAPASVSTFV